MSDLVGQDIFKDKIRAMEENDYGHPSYFNPTYQDLLNNDVALKQILATQQAETASELMLRATQASLDTTNTVINTKASITYVDAQLESVVDGTPEAFADLVAISAAYPSGNGYVKLNLADGYVYKWDGETWIQGWVYLATPLTDDQVYDILKWENPLPKKTMTNAITNGDFSGGTTGWTQLSGSTWSVTDAVLSLTGTGTINNPQVCQQTAIDCVPGHKIYVKSKFKVTNANCLNIRYMISSTGMTTVQPIIKDHPISGMTYTDSAILTLGEGGSTALKIYVAQYYADAATANGKVLEIDNVLAVDLTALFGAGMEPTQAQMDGYLYYYDPTNLWFDGTKVIPLEIADGKIFTSVNGVMQMVPLDEFMTGALIPIEDTEGYFVGTNVEMALAEIAQPLKGSFVSEIVSTGAQDLIPVTNPTWLYTTSTFSGWGAPIGAPQNFNTLVFKIRNRVANTVAITSIRAGVTILNKSGTVLADKTITGLNILPGEEQTISFVFNTPVVNAGEEQLYGAFMCDQLIDMWGGATDTILAHSYKTAGVLAAISTMIDVLTVPNYNKAMLYAATSITAYVPTQTFLDLIVDNSTVMPTEDILLNIAPVVPCVVGEETNIYFENILNTDNINNCQVNVVCTKGQQQVERWTYIPLAEDVGDTDITVEIYRKNVLLASVSGLLRVSETTKALIAGVQIVGDSTTANNTMISELANRVTADANMDITFIGTQGVGVNKHEGYSGRTTSWIYTDDASPFVYSGVFDYATYLSTNVLPTPDIVILNMGINDMFIPTSDVSALAEVAAMIAKYDAIMENIKITKADMIFGICVTIPSGNQDAFGSYGSGQTSWRYNRNNRLLTNALINYYRENAGVHLIPINVAVDTVNNMAMAASVPINSRNPATITRQTNGVHPGPYGYYQIADMDYYWLKSLGA